MLLRYYNFHLFIISVINTATRYLIPFSIIIMIMLIRLNKNLNNYVSKSRNRHCRK